MLCGIFRAAAHEKRITFDGINKKSYAILRDLTQIPAYIPRDIRVTSAYIPAYIPA
jgi:hypothetical protein